MRGPFPDLRVSCLAEVDPTGGNKGTVLAWEILVLASEFTVFA